MGGLGLHSQSETSAAAFIGGVEISLPHIKWEDGICHQLGEVVGRVEGHSRWETFLEGGSHTATAVSTDPENRSRM